MVSSLNNFYQTKMFLNSKMFFKQNHRYWLWEVVNPEWHHVRTARFHPNEPFWYVGTTCSPIQAKSLSPRMLLHSSASRLGLCKTASLHNHNHRKHKDGRAVSDKRSPEMISGKYQGKSAKMKLYVLLYCPDVLLLTDLLSQRWHLSVWQPVLHRTILQLTSLIIQESIYPSEQNVRKFLKLASGTFDPKWLIFQITFQVCHSAINLLTAQITTLGMQCPLGLSRHNILILIF